MRVTARPRGDSARGLRPLTERAARTILAVMTNCSAIRRSARAPRIFLPEGLADDLAAGRPINAFRAAPAAPVEVVVRDPKGRERPVAPQAPRPVGEVAWRCSLSAATMLRDLLDLPVGDEDPRALRQAADDALASARASCTFAGRSPQGSDVWALPRGNRRIGLVLASGADLPGIRTIVCVLTPAKMDQEYPAGAPPIDWREAHLRGQYALRALELLAEEGGPDSDAARHLAIARGSTGDELQAMVGDSARG